MNNEFPPFVTVLRSFGGKFYSAVMEWNGHDERYELSGDRVPGKLHKIKTDAQIDAEALAQKLEMQVRL